MKRFRSVLLLLAVICSINARATQYVIIKQTWLGQIRFIYVPKPAKLEKWYYDQKADTYFRMKTAIGIPVKIIKPRNCTVLAS
ncbi:MAG: hypothetical protein JWQ38_256 [Flavipsychrobacter sp.]|nr:hypothetical protein [Flavipsychrobacter sp.]